MELYAPDLKLTRSQRSIVDRVRKKLEWAARDPKFYFDPERHRYTYEGRTMKGCTSLVKDFAEPFDHAYWLSVKAKERGITPEDLEKEWDDKRDRAGLLGTMVHDAIERFYRTGSREALEDGEADSRFRAFLRLWESRLKVLYPISVESRVHDTDYDLAGTFDGLFLHGESVVMGDWKTNKKFTTDKDKHYRMLRYPFEDLRENTLNTYSIQVSIYRHILWKWNIDTEYAFICHIPLDGEDAALYRAKDLRKRITDWLKESEGKANTGPQGLEGYW